MLLSQTPSRRNLFDCVMVTLANDQQHNNDKTSDLNRHHGAAATVSHGVTPLPGMGLVRTLVLIHESLIRRQRVQQQHPCPSNTFDPAKLSTAVSRSSSSLSPRDAVAHHILSNLLVPVLGDVPTLGGVVEVVMRCSMFNRAEKGFRAPAMAIALSPRDDGVPDTLVRAALEDSRRRDLATRGTKAAFEGIGVDALMARASGYYTTGFRTDALVEYSPMSSLTGHGVCDNYGSLVRAINDGQNEENSGDEECIPDLDDRVRAYLQQDHPTALFCRHRRAGERRRLMAPSCSSIVLERTSVVTPFWIQTIRNTAVALLCGEATTWLTKESADGSHVVLSESLTANFEHPMVHELKRLLPVANTVRRLRLLSDAVVQRVKAGALRGLAEGVELYISWHKKQLQALEKELSLRTDVPHTTHASVATLVMAARDLTKAVKFVALLVGVSSDVSPGRLAGTRCSDCGLVWRYEDWNIGERCFCQLPSGHGRLTGLYEKVRQHELMQTSSLRQSARSVDPRHRIGITLFGRASHYLLMALQSWLRFGRVVDPAHEFFIKKTNERGERVAPHLVIELVPCFIAPAMAEEILQCGISARIGRDDGIIHRDYLPRPNRMPLTKAIMPHMGLDRRDVTDVFIFAVDAEDVATVSAAFRKDRLFIRPRLRSLNLASFDGSSVPASRVATPRVTPKKTPHSATEFFGSSPTQPKAPQTPTGSPTAPTSRRSSATPEKETGTRQAHWDAAVHAARVEMEVEHKRRMLEAETRMRRVAWKRKRMSMRQRRFAAILKAEREAAMGSDPKSAPDAPHHGENEPAAVSSTASPAKAHPQQRLASHHHQSFHVGGDDELARLQPDGDAHDGSPTTVARYGHTAEAVDVPVIPPLKEDVAPSNVVEEPAPPHDVPQQQQDEEESAPTTSDQRNEAPCESEKTEHHQQEEEESLVGMTESSTCMHELKKGGVCGRARPCRYHDKDKPRRSTEKSKEEERASSNIEQKEQQPESSASSPAHDGSAAEATPVNEKEDEIEKTNTEVQQREMNSDEATPTKEGDPPNKPPMEAEPSSSKPTEAEPPLSHQSTKDASVKKVSRSVHDQTFRMDEMYVQPEKEEPYTPLTIEQLMDLCPSKPKDDDEYHAHLASLWLPKGTLPSEPSSEVTSPPHDVPELDIEDCVEHSIAYPVGVIVHNTNVLMLTHLFDPSHMDVVRLLKEELFGVFLFSDGIFAERFHRLAFPRLAQLKPVRGRVITGNVVDAFKTALPVERLRLSFSLHFPVEVESSPSIGRSAIEVLRQMKVDVELPSLLEHVITKDTLQRFYQPVHSLLSLWRFADHMTAQLWHAVMCYQKRARTRRPSAGRNASDVVMATRAYLGTVVQSMMSYIVHTLGAHTRAFLVSIEPHTAERQTNNTHIRSLEHFRQVHNDFIDAAMQGVLATPVFLPTRQCLYRILSLVEDIYHAVVCSDYGLDKITTTIMRLHGDVQAQVDILHTQLKHTNCAEGDTLARVLEPLLASHF